MTDVLDPGQEEDGVTHAGVAGLNTTGDGKEAAEWKASDDGNIVERGGVKYVRNEALLEERQARQQLSATLAKLDPVMPEFEEFLAQKQNRGRAATQRTAAPSDSDDYSDDELDGLAVTRGYYEGDNITPDRKRAKSEMDILTKIADRRTARQVKPVADQNVRERATTNRAAAAERKFLDGEPVAGEKYMKAAMDALPDDYIADANIANITQVIAAGLEYLDMRKSGTIRRGRGREPMFVERGTGRFDGDDGPVSGLSAAAARARGKTPEQWSKMSKAVNAKSNSTLEDIQ